MKYLLIFVLLSLALLLFCAEELTLDERLKRYSGKNYEELASLLKNTPADTLKYVQFLLENSSQQDISVLTADQIMTNIRLALKTRDLPYLSDISEKDFMHFVLPMRIAQEPFEPWRSQFYEELLPLVENETNIEKAITLINLWSYEQMTFVATSGRDQAPLTTIRRGYGRCEEMMIIFIAAARSVGIPARSASVPYWNFTDNNHAWTEVWTPDGWKFLGSAEPSIRIREAWFARSASRATVITSRAFGNYESEQTLRVKNNASLLTTTNYYTDSYPSTFYICDVNNEPIADAKVMLYGLSWGGAFAMLSFDSDSLGYANINLGRGSVFYSVSKDSLFNCGILNTMEGGLDLTVMLSETQKDSFEGVLQFPLPKSFKSEDEITFDDFAIRKEVAGLRRKNRLNNSKKIIGFVDYFEQLAHLPTDEFNALRKSYLKNCLKLADNTDRYLKVFAAIKDDYWKTDVLLRMLTKWDIKELTELPDSSAIMDVVEVYYKGRLRYDLPDSIWVDHVLSRTFSRIYFPEDGWRKQFYETIENQITGDIVKTVENITEWIDSATEVDSTIIYTYFSGSRNPNQILNMKHISERDRLLLMNSALTIAGVPTRWKGFLSYYNGEEFIEITVAEDEEKPERREIELVVSVYIDGKQVKAESSGNFLITSKTDSGIISYIYYEDEQDSLDCKITYFIEEKDVVYIEAVVRNGNGDSHFILRKLDPDEKHVVVELNTPKEYYDATSKWDVAILDKVRQIGVDNRGKDESLLIFVYGEQDNEPQIRMFDEIMSKLDKMEKKNCQVLVYAENGSKKINFDNLISGEKFVNIISTEYPVLFLINDKNEIIFSTRGYNNGITDLLIRKL
ncbi:MAG: transglutaminase-like domain-containing protein [Candidatus Cloacimonetes bacterium]|nr:transglutaminase-like domain-containing protein [Candidatus Cloacimonadota bacterium]